MSDESRKQSRREFLRGVGRAAAAAGLVGGVAGLVAAGRARPPQDCVNNGFCRACGAYEDCALPAALSAKREGTKP
jgi:hypothetical protein